MQAAETGSQFAHEQAGKVGNAASNAKEEAASTYSNAKAEFGSMKGLLATMMKETAGGQVSIQRMQDYIVAFVVIGVVGAAGLLILTSMKQDAEQDENNSTEAVNGIGNAIEGITEMLGFLPTIGLVVAAVIIISLLAGFQLGGRGGGQRRRA
jgi:hypothetical protein